MAAVLGSNENKQAFVESQKGIPDLLTFKLSNEEKEKLRLKIEVLVTALAENLDKKNQLAQHRLEIENTKTEYQSEEHTSELQSRENLVCRLLLEKKKKYR